MAFLWSGTYGRKQQCSLPYSCSSASVRRASERLKVAGASGHGCTTPHTTNTTRQHFTSTAALLFSVCNIPLPPLVALCKFTSSSPLPSDRLLCRCNSRGDLGIGWPAAAAACSEVLGALLSSALRCTSERNNKRDLPPANIPGLCCWTGAAAAAAIPDITSVAPSHYCFTTLSFFFSARPRISTRLHNTANTAVLRLPPPPPPPLRPTRLHRAPLPRTRHCTAPVPTIYSAG